jgi:hypothetical protein
VVVTAPTLHLEGNYWTEPATRGQIRSVGHNPTIFETFEAAEAATFTL